MLKKEDSLIIYCPKSMISNEQTFTFLLDAHAKGLKCKESTMIWNMVSTKVFETNLLSLMFYIFEELANKKGNVCYQLPNGNTYYYKASVMDIFNFYAADKRSFYKPRKVGIKNLRETEDLLLKYLKCLNLREYVIIKTLISEIIANVKMHTIYREGMISGSFSKTENRIILSIANYDFSIPNQIKYKMKAEFSSDYDAIIWSLKKANSTRNSDESGGLGLYLLRKYISQLKGKASILSGDCYLEIGEESYNVLDENRIEILSYKNLKDAYAGTIITIYIPYYVYDRDVIEEEELLNIDIIDI